jgi:hypothetical protein
MYRIITTFLLLGCLAVASIAAAAGETQSRHYFADVTLFSIVPEQGIDSLKESGGGGVSPRGTLGLSLSDGSRKFDVKVVGQLKKSRFVATLTITPDEKDQRTKPITKEFDMTDLKPQVVEIGRDDDGRVYRLNLVPRVISHPRPKQFDAMNLGLQRWNFRRSPVIVNEQDLLGEINMAGGEIAYVDIPGFANVEFSLLPLRDAKPEGVLDGGTISIEHESQRLTISNVRTGDNPNTLIGGPYKVWIRWKKPSQTVEQYHDAVKKRLAILKAKIADGSLDVSEGTIERLEKAIEAGRVLMLTNGVRSVSKGEISP